MSEKGLILCVDDEPVNLVILEELLQENYELATATSGAGCLQQVAMRKPNLILLDVNMPDMDGLATCEELKSDPETADIPIIFVSALASKEELMAGYEAGGDDYITKPFSEEILQKKIEIVLASQRARLELKTISDRAAEALMDNLGTTGELGMVVRFLHRCQTANTLDELARDVFDCLREFELDSSLLILDQPQNRVWFSDDIDRPMEYQILESLRGQDRVVRFGTRLAVSSDHATLLVRNLPAAAEKIDRVREHLSILIEAMDTRIHAMHARALLDRRRQAFAQVLDATRDYLGKIDELHGRQKTRLAEIVSALGVELQKSLGGMNLSERQQATLKNIIAAGVAQTESIYDARIEIDERFQGIIDELSRALDG
ncbi:MAG: response regulator [Gammaproteobacteria bacterium]|nr:response regulator [Gammaproteobacteria bacterium]MDH3534431.1 response regulator [Gammaproteobacteria bacterium]